MQLHLNGESVEIADSTVAEVLVRRGLDPSQPGVAVAVNGTVVPRAAWAAYKLCEGDDVEVITAMQGG